MEINIQRPENIYEFVKQKVSELNSEIVRGEDIIGSTSATETMNESRRLLLAQQENIEKNIEDLKKNAEWDFYTIALFGETNAGKSTLIETLRIILGEDTKKETRQNFLKLRQSLPFPEKKFTQKNEELNTKTTLISERKSVAERLSSEHSTLSEEHQLQLKKIMESNIHAMVVKTNEYKQQRDKIEEESENLKQDYDHKIKTASWWKKVFHKFSPPEMDQRIAENDQILEKLKENFKKQEAAITKKNDSIFLRKKSDFQEKEEKCLTALSEENINIDNLVKEKNILTEEIRIFCDIIKKMDDLQDGKIIGFGGDDFTRKNQEFIFIIKGMKIKIIDVPGIEGDEKLVIDQISSAIIKSHAILYVTHKDASPNEGTLKKIQDHLSSQTEVWAIYNKPCTSLRVIRKGVTINPDNDSSLKGLDTTLRKSLGKSYRGLTTISALPAFCSVADCLLTSDKIYATRNKFISAMSSNELFENSGINNALEIINDKIINDIEKKIKTNNFTKVNKILKNTNSTLHSIENKINTLRNKTQGHAQETKFKIDSDYGELINNIKKTINSLTEEFTRNTRIETYDQIDRNISNDDLKNYFSRVTEENIEKFTSSLSIKFREYTSGFDQNIKSHLLILSSRLESEMKNFQNENIKSIESNFTPEFKINSGIKSMGLMGVGVGVAAAMWWNPVGWVSITLTVAGLLLSFTKSVIQFFNKEYKRSEQKKSVDSNLITIVKELEKSARKNLKTIEQTIAPELVILNQKIDQPAHDLLVLRINIGKSIKMLTSLSEKITLHYGV